MPEPVDGFLRHVLKSGLLSKEQLAETLRAVPDQATLADAQQLAQHLIRAGKLTRFQAHKLLQGATLGLRLGPYQLQTPIGKGGMGTVYLALDTRTGQHVAVKVLPPKRARAEERQLARFQREMAMSQRVSHTHLARTHEAGVSQGVYYIALEYIPGQSLHRLIGTSGPLSVPRAAKLFAEVAAALDHAHSKGLIHRDLKPSNIMITPNDHAKVLDLGLALMEGEAAEREVVGGKGYVVGSIDYMAPEQTEDPTKIDARADLYAVGCCLYFALTGKPPFPDGTHKDKANAHRTQQPVPLQWCNKGLPDGFAALVHKLLAKKPEDRLPSATALRKELLTWTAPEEAEVRPVEKEGDVAQQAAAAALEAAPPPTEPTGDSALFKAEPGAPEPTASLQELLDQDSKKDMRWIILAIAGFWAVVLLLLVLVLILSRGT